MRLSRQLIVYNFLLVVSKNQLSLSLVVVNFLMDLEPFMKQSEKYATFI